MYHLELFKYLQESIMKKLLFIFTLLISLPTWATLNDGVQAYQAGDFKTAHKEWLPLANQGDASAQYNLGQMYSHGNGVLKDYKQAVAWFKKAANQGLADAQYNLGVMYENGYGVLKDYKQAVTWYKKAANQGDATAQFNLGMMFYNGKGVLKDKSKAKLWIKKAYENNNPKISKMALNAWNEHLTD